MTLTAEELEDAFRQYQGRLLNYAVSRVRNDVWTAEDAAQEAWTIVWARRDQWRNGKPIIAWLQRLTKVAAQNMVHPRDTWAGPIPANPTPIGFIGEALDDQPDDGTPGTGYPGLADPQARQVIDDALSQIRPGEAKALRLHCIEGYDYAEAARIMNVSVECVRSCVCTGLARLRRLRDGHDDACYRCGWPLGSIGHAVSCNSRIGRPANSL